MERVHQAVRGFFDATPHWGRDGSSRVPLNVPSYGWEEVTEAIDSMLSGRVTMGNKVRAFERTFADYLGVKHAIMVNSGSSANLVALSVLTNPTLRAPIRADEEVIVPAVTWSTTVFPIVNVGATPVLVDISLEDYTMNITGLRNAITGKTRAIMPVHLLGTPSRMTEIMALARQYDLYVIEDACEAHGSEFDQKKVGTFGDLATFSFFFSHHISTIEGGMVVTNNDMYAEIARALRAHGWIRDLENRGSIALRYPNIDDRYLFANLGYNLRPTEIQGAFGLHQIGKLEPFIAIRQENARYYSERLGRFKRWLRVPEPADPPGVRRVWFGFPLLVKPEAPFSREELTRFLELRQIETRPIMAGNMAEQPAMRLVKHEIRGTLQNAEVVMRQGFFVGNHQGITRIELDYFVACIDEFMSRYL